MKRTLPLIIFGALIWLIGAPSSFAQTSPNWTFGFVPSQAQWNTIFGSKQDFLGAPPLLTTGGTMTGPLVSAASVAGNSGFNVPPGVAPTVPSNGDMWDTAAGFFVRVNGVTVGPLAPALSTSPTGGIGYTTGSGGAVTQLTSRTTGVTLNTVTGAITLFTAAGSATAATFTVTDSAVAATDVIDVVQKSGANLYEIFITAVAAGSFNVTFLTTGGTVPDAPVFSFVVIKGSIN